MRELDLRPRTTCCLTARNYHHLIYPSSTSPQITLSLIPSNISQLSSLSSLSIPPQFSQNPPTCLLNNNSSITKSSTAIKRQLFQCHFCQVNIYHAIQQLKHKQCHHVSQPSKYKQCHHVTQPLRHK